MLHLLWRWNGENCSRRPLFWSFSSSPPSSRHYCLLSGWMKSNRGQQKPNSFIWAPRLSCKMLRSWGQFKRHVWRFNEYGGRSVSSGPRCLHKPRAGHCLKTGAFSSPVMRTTLIALCLRRHINGAFCEFKIIQPFTLTRVKRSP